MKKYLLLIAILLILPSIAQQASSLASTVTIITPSTGEEDVSVGINGTQTCILIDPPQGCSANVTFQWFNYSHYLHDWWTSWILGHAPPSFYNDTYWTNYSNWSNINSSTQLCAYYENVSCMIEGFSIEFWWRIIVDYDCGFDETVYSYFYTEDCQLFYIYPEVNNTEVCPCCDSICIGANNTYGHPMNITIYGSYDNTNFWTWNKYTNVTNGSHCFCMNSIYLESTPSLRGEWIGASGIQAPGAKPATLEQHGCAISWEFSDNQEEEVQFTVRIPTRINLSFPITLDIGWSSPAINKVCNWNLSYSITAFGEDTYENCEYYQDVLAWSSSTIDGLTNYRFTFDEVAEGDKCFHFTIERDGNDATDNLSDVANLLGICFSYYLDDNVIHPDDIIRPMQYNTTYYWYVNITDTVTGEYNISETFQFHTAQNRTDCLTGFNQSIYNSIIDDGLNNYYHSTVGIVGLLGLTYVFFRRKKRNK